MRDPSVDNDRKRAGDLLGFMVICYPIWRARTQSSGGDRARLCEFVCVRVLWKSFCWQWKRFGATLAINYVIEMDVVPIHCKILLEIIGICNKNIL